MLNLGSGLQHRPGWINYDRSRAVAISRRPRLRALAGRAGYEIHRWPPNTRSHDLTKGIPHAECSVDAIYASHLLEHLWPEDAEFLLNECYRVLKVDGVLRIVIPDLELLASRYLDRDRDFFGVEDGRVADGFMAWLRLRRRPRGGLPERLIRRAFRVEDDGHRWMYDGASMSDRMVAAGFSEVEVVGYRQGRDAEVAALDSRPRDSVHIEGTKRSDVRERSS
jgi:SAM-dependent methyltransferase